MRPNLQATILSSSSFARKSREGVFRLHRLTTFFWIAATVRAHDQRVSQNYQEKWWCAIAAGSKIQQAKDIPNWLNTNI